MKILLFAVRLVMMTGVYALSLYVFKNTSLYADLDSFSQPLFSADLAVTVAVILFALLFLPGKNSSWYIYLVCALLFLPATSGYLKYNWIDMYLFNFDFNTSLTEARLSLTGFLIFIGCMVIHYTVSYQVATEDFSKREIRKVEINCTLLNQGKLTLFVLFIVGLLVAAFFKVAAFAEQALEKMALSLSFSPVAIACVGLFLFLLLGLFLIHGIRSSHPDDSEERAD